MRWSTTRSAAPENRGRSHQAVHHAARSVARLLARRGRAVPRDRAGPTLVDTYTARGNLVAVITNGTAVLGLGNIGPLAAKPVMEGKALLFKRLADIDVFDLELDGEDPDRFIEAVSTLEPTFGAINLEDIKAPECFYIEEALKKRMAFRSSTTTSTEPRSSPAPRCSTRATSPTRSSTKSRSFVSARGLPR